MYSNIVAGTDGSDIAELAVRHAAELARLAGARLHLVTAVSSTPVGFGPDIITAMPPSWVDANVDAAQERLTALQRSFVDPSVDVTTRVLQGEPAEILLRYCEEIGADMLVVGNKGVHGARRWLLGSVANRCVHHADCAVLVVPSS